MRVLRVTGPGDFFFKPFFVEESLGREKERKGEGMSKMIDRWLQKAKERDNPHWVRKVSV